ncbi:hypothetical protein AB0N05_22035 [Nocardia sp. NPDC051030]|uniref:DUF7373 family lipoprotein n=1 Tax=Nocardia sp. NPDC051030 TaxID=3155162 RepID=UPI00344951E6
MLFDIGRRPHARAAVAAVLSALALVTVSCGSESDSDTGQSVDLAKLDVGNYPTKPQPWEPKDRTEAARNQEGLRLGDIMPVGEEIDPALKIPGATRPFLKAAKPTGGTMFSWLNTSEFTNNTPGLVAGFGAAAESNLDREISTRLSNNVLLFDSDAAAASAASALARSGFEKSSGGPAQTRSTQYPTASVMWLTEYQVLASWYATGRFVIVEVVEEHTNVLLKQPDQTPLLALADKAISVTADRLKAFQPTPKDKLADLAVDSEGMLQRSLRTADATFTGTLDAHGALHMADGLDSRSSALYEKTGVDIVGFGGRELFRARDSAAAATLVRESTTNRVLVAAESPPELPQARCVKYRGPVTSTVPYYCNVSYGRYAARVWSDQLKDAQQQIAAQYAILVNSK